MNPAGLVLVIVGLWVSSQVLAGNALQRLGIIKPSGDEPGPGAALPFVGGQFADKYLPGGTYNPPFIDLDDIFGGRR